MEHILISLIVMCIIGVLVFRFLLSLIPDATIRMLVQLLLVVLAIFWLLRVSGAWPVF